MKLKLLTPLLIISLLVLLQGCASPAHTEAKAFGANKKISQESLQQIYNKFVSSNPEYVALLGKYYHNGNTTTLTQKMNPEFLTKEERAILIKGYDNWLSCCQSKWFRVYASPVPEPYRAEIIKILTDKAQKKEVITLNVLAGKITIGEWATLSSSLDVETDNKVNLVTARYNQDLDQKHEKYMDRILNSGDTTVCHDIDGMIMCQDI